VPGVPYREWQLVIERPRAHTIITSSRRFIGNSRPGLPWTAGTVAEHALEYVEAGLICARRNGRPLARLPIFELQRGSCVTSRSSDRKPIWSACKDVQAPGLGRRGQQLRQQVARGARRPRRFPVPRSRTVRRVVSVSGPAGP
jgi:hypothetical protein